MTAEALAAILRRSSVILLDFDGPVCSVFAGYPAPQITEELRAVAVDQVGKLPPELDAVSSPHEFLAASATISVQLAQQIEAALQAAELKAVETATQTPGIADFLVACSEAGRQVAIVSNNAGEAVKAYLIRAGLDEFISHIEARDPSDPALMKPNPHLILRAVSALAVAPEQCLLIGDQVTDVAAAKAAKVAAIGYANKPGKADALSDAGSDAVISGIEEMTKAMSDLTSAVGSSDVDGDNPQPTRPILMMISFERSSQQAVAIWSNGMQLKIPVEKEYFAPTSQLQHHQYIPPLNVLIVTTTKGDRIVCELPPFGGRDMSNGRPTIYLDQNHWSTLFKAVHAPDRVPEQERLAAMKLIELARDRKILLPVSAGTYAETTKFVDNVSRYRLGTTLLQLSAGWQLRDPLEVRRAEIRNALIRFGGTGAEEVHEPVVTLEPNVIHGRNRGNRVKAGTPDLPDDINYSIAAITSALSMIDVTLDSEPIPPNPPTGWAAWNQQFSEWIDGETRSTEQKRASIDTALFGDLRVEIAEEAARAGVTPEQLTDWNLNRFSTDIAKMPSLGLWREVMHQRHLNKGTTWLVNDLTDIIYLSCAAGYVDFVVCERATAGTLGQAVKRRGTGAQIFRRLQDAVPVIAGAVKV